MITIFLIVLLLISLGSFYIYCFCSILAVIDFIKYCYFSDEGKIIYHRKHLLDIGGTHFGMPYRKKVKERNNKLKTVSKISAQRAAFSLKMYILLACHYCRIRQSTQL